MPDTPVGVRRLTAEDLFVVFQPIVDVATGRTFAQEALVRCRHPDYPSPPVLFQHAAREGVCGRLGRLIRDIAFASHDETTPRPRAERHLPAEKNTHDITYFKDLQT